MGYLLTTTWFKGVFDIPSNFTDSEDESSCAARRVETLRRTRRDDKERTESEREARLTSDTKNAKARDDAAGTGRRNEERLAMRSTGGNWSRAVNGGGMHYTTPQCPEEVPRRSGGSPLLCSKDAIGEPVGTER